MSVFEAVRTMLAVRGYADRPVPDATLRRILEAGRLTASSMNKQPWHFVVVRERATLRELAALAGSGPYIAEAAAAIVVGIERASTFGVSDASRAAQSMMLTAWEEGVGSNWVGFVPMDKVRDFVGLPAEFDVLTVVALGYPAAPAGKGKKRRKPLGEIASSERFGRPLE